ncbi:hypothetical protein ADIS_0646 [Lunatimonas lonarensis]|uniref:Uncharacterized protein n=1 Tax=Lunatimonas lonarensis TaxID=1232681 RepID=R7ZXN5_9BACT|nr:hypothetical protein [Lunatimonas lonarensis]EON78749.1 hypothetical protein ADIS_0646 [Lunatimonas lonarensis]
MKDNYLGVEGTPERHANEYELKMEVLGEMIKSTNKEREIIFRNQEVEN